MTRSRHLHSSHWGAFYAVVEDGSLVGTEPFERDRQPSPIVNSVIDGVYARNRIDQPYVRQGWLERGPTTDNEERGAEPFVPVSWDKALNLVVSELSRMRDAYGNDAIFGGSYGWASAGRFHHPVFLIKRFLSTIGGFTNAVGNYSVGAGIVILPHVVGTSRATGGPLTSWDAIAESTELMVSFGGLPLKNSQVADGGIADHSLEAWQREAKAAGVSFVNVSPNRADCADFLDAEWIPIRPNTDTAMMLALAHVLLTEDLHDRAFLSRYCVGWETFEPYLTGSRDGIAKSPEWAEKITEVPAHVIRSLARQMAESRTMLNTNLALQRGDHGEQPFWMTIVLAAMLGQIGLPGGGFGLGYGSIAGMGVPQTEVRPIRMPVGRNPVKSFIPVSRVADMLLNPGSTIDFNGQKITFPDIRLVYWAGGNPFGHHQDINRQLAAFRKPETIIVHEPWWTGFARFADIVLPVTTSLERNDLGMSTRDRYIMKMEQAIDPVGRARNDFDIFRELAERMGTGGEFTEDRDESGWLRHLYDVCRQQAAEVGVEMPPFDDFWEKGWFEIPPPREPFNIFAEFRANPDQHPLKTPSGKIEIYSDVIAGFGYDDCPGHPAWMAPAEWLGDDKAKRYPLHLLSNQPRHRLHGQLDMGRTSRAAKVAGREPVWINSNDASARGIADGDVVRIFNDRGACLAGAIVTDDMRKGVIQLPTHAQFDPEEPGRDHSLDKHGNPNVLALDKGTSRLAQAPSAQTTLVEVERVDGTVPEISAFDPPRIARA